MDWLLILEALAHFLGAFALALPIGWERERASRSAGLRTFPLVAAASCAYVLVGRASLGGDAQAEARLVQGLMTGIGFIGGGAILKGDATVRGTATAAGIWMTGAIGAAAGHGRWELAIAASILTFAALRWLTPVARGMDPAPADTDARDARDARTASAEERRREDDRLA